MKDLEMFGKTNKEEREKWLEKVLSQIPPGKRILDAGAGELQYKKFCSQLIYVSQDFAQYDGIGDGKGMQTKNRDHTQLDIICDINNIPEPDQSFDAIMCIEVFEHLPDPITTIKEFSRLLKPNGTLIITAPFCSITHYSPFHFYSGFNRYFYEKHLPDNGFVIEEIVSNGNYFEYLAQEVQYRIPNKYTTYRLNYLDKLILNKFVKILRKMDRYETNSDDLLCFGFHIKASKKN